MTITSHAHARDVSVAIPVHTPVRPIERAVGSVVADGARAIVVCHNTEPGPIRERLAGLTGDIELVELRDGIPSPAGPLNRGLDAVDTEFACVLGSDDFFEAGALTAWAGALREERGDVMMMRTRTVDHERPEESSEATIPHVRPGRRRRLDPVADRLGYRTGPMLLLRTQLLRDHGIRMRDGLRHGEDLEFTAKAFLRARRIDLAPASMPRHVVVAGAEDRIQAVRFPAEEMLLPAQGLRGCEWFTKAPKEFRRAYAIRTVRRDVLGTLVRHAQTLTPDGALAIQEELSAWLAVASIQNALSRGEERLIRELVATSDVEAQSRIAGDWSRLGIVDRLLPARPGGALDREQRARHAASGILNRQWDRIRP
ncbi:glycosyltransferase family 2 protein [uncultured Brachybacterium sp.]|uniref:glycosyltransferase family 2 protein n=1 Tax=uncultured Brachybacterium sp. TaxID=189680 RepID=UPI002604395E|nr:hypothetical protein [uncultured Brachybacterium sp.]